MRVPSPSRHANPPSAFPLMLRVPRSPPPRHPKWAELIEDPDPSTSLPSPSVVSLPSVASSTRPIILFDSQASSGTMYHETIPIIVTVPKITFRPESKSTSGNGGAAGRRGGKARGNAPQLKLKFCAVTGHSYGEKSTVRRNAVFGDMFSQMRFASIKEGKERRGRTVPHRSDHAEWGGEPSVRPLCVDKVASGEDQAVRNEKLFISAELEETCRGMVWSAPEGGDEGVCRYSWNTSSRHQRGEGDGRGKDRAKED